APALHRRAPTAVAELGRWASLAALVFVAVVHTRQSRDERAFDDADADEQPDTVPERDALIDRRQPVEVFRADSTARPGNPERDGERDVGDERECPADDWEFIYHGFCVVDVMPNHALLPTGWGD